MDNPYEVDPDIEDGKRENFASDIVRLACLWVAAGALYKLFAGSPADLPKIVRDQSPLSIAGTFRAAISIELVIVILCLFRPRAGWFLLVALFGVFDAILWPLVQAGETSCGCFGGTITIKPLYMMIIDSVLLVAILMGKPWSSIPKRPLQPLILLPLIGLAVWAPFHMFKGLGKMELPVRPAVHQNANTEIDHVPDKNPSSENTELPLPEGTPEHVDTAEPAEVGTNDGEGTEADQAETDIPDPPPAPVGWAPRSPLPQWHIFDVASWENQLLFDIDVYHFIDVEQFPDTCHVIFYRQTCEHCAAHLQDISINPPAVPIVLVRLIEDNDTEENNVIQELPDTPFYFEAPALERGYDMQTPVTMDVEEFMISNVQERTE